MGTNFIHIMEWTYSPADFFEDPLSIESHDYSLSAHDGKASATIQTGDALDAEPVYQSIHRLLLAHFIATLVISHRRYELSEYTTVRIDPAGNRHFVLRVESGTMRMSAANVDFKVSDASGKIIADTRADRIATQRKLAELASRHLQADVAAESILGSYEAAVNDETNELIFLYEIRETIAVRFNGSANAQSQLGVPEAAWHRLGVLANVEPLRQGRHRGRQPGRLRDATSSELSEARSIARLLIQSYLTWLDNLHDPPTPTISAL